MKKKHIYLFFIPAILLLFLSACGPKNHNFRLLHNDIPIVKIEIGLINSQESEEPKTFHSFAEVNDIDTFMDELLSLPYSEAASDPVAIPPADAIKITYENGDYELVSSAGITEGSGELFFDNEEFSDLLEHNTQHGYDIHKWQIEKWPIQASDYTPDKLEFELDPEAEGIFTHYGPIMSEEDAYAMGRDLLLRVRETYPTQEYVLLFIIQSSKDDTWNFVFQGRSGYAPDEEILGACLTVVVHGNSGEVFAMYPGE